MALIRAGFLQWSLTWHDLDTAFNHPPATLDLLRASIRSTGSENPMTQVQHVLDGRWGTGPLRGQIRTFQSSFDLLLLYLKEPDGEKWRRAVFTEALCLFDRSRMASKAFRERFEAVARDLLPEGARNSLAKAGSSLLFAGGGPEFGSDFENATLLAAMPASAIQGFKPEELSLVLHLDDRRPTSGGYRDLWNGVLRTFNRTNRSRTCCGMNHLRCWVSAHRISWGMNSQTRAALSLPRPSWRGPNAASPC